MNVMHKHLSRSAFACLAHLLGFFLFLVLCRIFIDRCRPDYDTFQEITHLTPEQEQDLAEQQARLKEMREKIARQKLEAQTQMLRYGEEKKEKR